MEGTALPPLQVGVWIPKAKMGPEADNFRPLGMPNTLDRLDGSIAAVVMKAVASNLHPSQTVDSNFGGGMLTRVDRHPFCMGLQT